MTSSVSINTPAVPARTARRLIDRALAQCELPEPQLSQMRARFEEAAGLKAMDTEPTRIKAAALIRLYESVAQIELPADFYLRESNEFRVADYGMLGYAMMSAANLGQAIQIALKFYPTAGPLLDVDYAEDAEFGYVVLHDNLGLPERVLQDFTEDLLSTFPPLIEQLIGKRPSPVVLELAYPAPDNANVYADYFRCTPVFDRRQTRFGFHKQLCESPIIHADADAVQLLEASCQALLDEIAGHHSFGNELRGLLMASPGKILTAQHAAEHFNVSERTLRRRLAAEHTSFQAVLDEVRCRIAMDYLRSTTLSIQQIGELLGFSEATNFRRAFVRWTKVSPHAYRRDNAVINRLS